MKSEQVEELLGMVAPDRKENIQPISHSQS